MVVVAGLERYLVLLRATKRVSCSLWWYGRVVPERGNCTFVEQGESRHATMDSDVWSSESRDAKYLGTYLVFVEGRAWT
jgi:hypothetical protein